MSGKSCKQMKRHEVIQRMLDKDNMRRNASPRLVEAIEYSYSNMTDARLEEMYWYCYYENIQVIS